MTYVQRGSVENMAGDLAQALTRDAAEDIVDTASRYMTERAAENTPKRTGRTAASFKPTPTRHERERIVGGTESHSFKARLLEHGTAPHIIRAKRADALNTPHGPRDSVQHPGVRGSHAIARAVAETEGALDTLAAGPLQRWARRVEKLGDA